MLQKLSIKLLDLIFKKFIDELIVCFQLTRLFDYTFLFEYFRFFLCIFAQRNMSIVVESVSKWYGQQKALDAISFEAKPGEILGFLGPNGAGKSTTMKILTGYIQASSGSANICGIQVNENAISIRKKIGYLPELNPLYAEMYIREYLSFVASIYEIKNIASSVDRVIQETGISPERNKKIFQLSKGYKQRVGLAAALIHDPAVLILDEPTSGLDPNQVSEIRQLIRSISKQKTVLFSTHIMQEVEALCQRVVIINKGKIVANDTVQSIKQTSTNEFKINIQFKNPISVDLISSHLQINSIEYINDTYIIYAPNDIREELSKLANKNEWIILSMQLENQSIENVFHTLTKLEN